MKEIRLTLNADDFGAISQALIGMGIGFRVEPVEEAPAEAAPVRASVPPRVAAPSPAPKRRPPKKNPKSADRPHQRRSEPLVTGADRLRSALTRNQGTADLTSLREARTEGAGDAARSASPDESREM